MLRLGLVGSLVVVLCALLAGGAAADTIAVSKMAALGDSITAAWDPSRPGHDPSSNTNWADSWSTGTDGAVSSHRARLGATAATQNLAIPGARWNSGTSIAAQAQQVAADTQYVTILPGSADACSPSAAGFLRTASTPAGEPNGIPTAAEYGSTLRSALNVLRSKNASMRVLVVSIPNWSQLRNPGFAPVGDGLCPLLFGSDPGGFSQRLQELNSAAAAVCAEFSGTCAYDGGAAYGAGLAPADLTSYDNFHLSEAGEAKIAAATWPAAQALLQTGGSGGGGGGGGGGSGTVDLSVSGSASPSPGTVGDGVVLRLQARLLSGALATNVVLSATLPAGLQLVSTQTDRGPGCIGTQIVVCNLDFLNGQATTGNVVLVARPTAPGQLTVPLEVSSAGGDANAADNRASLAVTIGGPGGGTTPARASVKRVGTTPLRTIQARRQTSWVSLAAAVQARNATSLRVSVVPFHRSAALTLLKGSRVGPQTAVRDVRSISIQPGTTTRQLALRLRAGALAKGKRYEIVITARNATSAQTIRIPVRG